MKTMNTMKCSTTVALLAGLALLATGCATALPPMPEVGVERTGEPLSVHTETRSYTYTTEEKAGEVVHRDSSGREIGSSEVYVEREKTAYYDVWFGMQGNQKVDEADFYRLAGDEALADEIIAKRKSAHTLNRIGVFGGAAAAATGMALMYTRLFAYDPTNPGGGTGLLYASSGLLLTGALGIAIGYVSARKLQDEFRFTDAQQAASAVRQMNASDADPNSMSYLRGR